MRILRLALKNFMVFSDVDLDLSKVNLVSIVGQHVDDDRRSNGSGKTALIEAIRYAIFDESRGKQADSIIKDGENSCTVELDFQVDSDIVKVLRTRSSDGKCAAKLLVNDTLVCDKLKSVNSELQKIVGIDSTLFDLIYFFKQGDQFGFAEASASERKQILASVFRMDHLVRCHKMITEQVKLTKEAKTKIDGAVENARRRLQMCRPHQLVLERKNALEALISKADENRIKQANILNESQSKLKKIEDDFLKWLNETKASTKEIERYEEEISEIASEISDLKSEYETVECSIAELTAKIDSYREDERFRDYDDDLNSKLILELQSKIGELNASIKINRSELDSIHRGVCSEVSAGSICPTCSQEVSELHIDSLRKLADAKINRISNLVQTESNELSECKKSLVKLNADSVLYKSIIKSRSSIEVLRERRSNSNERLAQISILVKKGEEKLRETQCKIDAEKIQFNPELISSTRARYQSEIEENKASIQLIDKSIRSAQSEIESHKFELGKVESEISEIESATKALADIEESYLITNRQFNVESILLNVFGKDGIQAIVIENAIGAIESFANEILVQMHTRFSIALKTQKQLKSGEDRESLDIIVYDNGRERPFDQYSGGEKTIVNLAIRLSLSKIISSMHGVVVKSLFLDEVLGALDSVNREEVIKVISFLSRSFEFVAVISHTQEILSLVDAGILIQRHSNHSTARLTNV